MTVENQSLADEKREMVRARILRATLDGLSEVGVDVRVEDIASIAGVGRRTIFRYFSTRDELLIAALELAIHHYLDAIPQRDGRPVERWLPEVVEAAARSNATYGIGYWQLVLVTDLEGPFGEALSTRRATRQKWSKEIAVEAWQGSGGKRNPPEWLIQAFALHLGPFSTAGLRIDSELALESVVAICTRILEALLRDALGEKTKG